MLKNLAGEKRIMKDKLRSFDPGGEIAKAVKKKPATEVMW